MRSVLVFLLIVKICVFTTEGVKNECEELKANSCGECILNPNCAWCADPLYANNPNVIISRCNLPDILESDGCNPDQILNPQSSQTATKDEPHSSVGESDVGAATQIRPQEIEVKARPGQAVTVTLAFKQAEDYPVDLYYLLDLSKSMSDDLDSLRKLGEELGKSMQKITRDFRLGFGSFIDKTVMPYISTVPSKIKNPCPEMKPCRPAYSFHNDLPLSSNIDEFVSSVENVTHSSNLDNPEGVLDAMMQAIVCQEEISWRKQATHLLVVSTDAGFHYAGDGKLGGIVLPHDGNCYLNDAGEYTMANKMDYPSIGHLVKKITQNNIQPIFAVTSTVVETYKNFADMIPKSVVGELTSDSSNVIQLIQDAYNDLKGQVTLEVETEIPDILITNEKSMCGDEGEGEGLKCGGVKIGDTVEFSFDLSVDQVCLSEPVKVTVSPFGYDEYTTIWVYPECDCECTEPEVKSNCSGHGVYECGACVCNDGFSGLDCACNLEGVDFDDYLVNCTDPQTGVVCSDRGECQCGQCLCKQYPNRKIDGSFCECDNTTCLRHQGEICNGHGTCNCGTCECEEMWSGDSCECPLDNASCYDTRDVLEDSTEIRDAGKPCNGNGVCECGVCVCNETSNGGGKYRGQFCETQPVVVCNQYEDCILCLIYQRENDSIVCDPKCDNYDVVMLSKDEGSSFTQYCQFNDPYDDCQFQAYYQAEGDLVHVEVEEEKICLEYIDPMLIIIGIIGGIVAIGLAILFIWKLLTTIKDEREFKKFEQETLNPDWSKNENPIFKKATSTFKNPTYGNTSN